MANADPILTSLHGKRCGITAAGNFVVDGKVIGKENPSGGQDYYVDGNRSAAGAGYSWDTALTTLAAAIALSDISIALTANRWWARRNRIFVAADTLTETLVKFPTKCDVIGVGAYDANAKPGIIGHHVPVGESYSTRFFNIKFNGIAAAAPLITIGSTSAGMEFHGCDFDGTAGTMTIGIQCTASHSLVVNDCDFYGTFVTSYITFGTGEAGRARITNNRMLGTAAKGIVAGSGMTTSWPALIDRNIINATGLVIDDDADLFYISNNQLFSATDPTADSTGIADVNQLRCINNKVQITAAQGTERNFDFPFVVATTS